MRRGLLTIAAVVVATLALAAVSFAEDGSTQEEYIAQVEPICKRNTDANKNILAGVRRMIKAGKRKSAAQRFARAANAFHKATNKIAAVPRPLGYEFRLEKWIDRLGLVETNLRNIGKAVRTRNQRQLVISELKLRSSGNAANNIVYDFPFRQCRVTPSRFS